ncbi:MAG TPA: BTAD domain-containing putative transcriptional regulator [Gemmatimonadaceae bacterium]|nr:BTAD domain-containing putative transcriptional regulator [Gemmatimonadaceae bacterium]
MLRLRTFGGLSLDREGSPTPGAAVQRYPLALLALLAVAGSRGISRDRIIALLWPESDDERSRHSLAQLLYAVRRALHADVVLAGAVELRLNAELLTSDVAELEAALESGDDERAAQLYTGPFLDGCHLSISPEFERWVDGERARLAGRMARALESLASSARQRGDRGAAVEWWRRLAALDPLNTRAARGLIEALAAAGDRAGALQFARVHETLLREELSAEPDAAFRALVDQVRRSSTASDNEPAPPRAVASSDEPPPTTVAHVSQSETAAHDAPPVATAPNAIPPRRRRRTPIIVATTLIIVAAALVMTLALTRRAESALDTHEVVVAAFDNQTGDTTLNALGQMAADWITEGIAQSGLAPVIDSRSAMASERDVAAHARSNDPTQRVRALAEQTGAGTVVWGSYYRVGDTLLFQARVSDARDGRVLLAIDPITGSVVNPSPAVQQLRQRALGALGILFNVRHSDWLQGTNRPPTYAAYQAYMAGLDLEDKYQYAQAIEHYARAYALDSTFVQPLIFAADAYKQGTGDYARADSLLRIVSRSQDRLSPFDRQFLANQQAELAGDWAGALHAAREMERLEPGSEAAVLVAEEALSLNYPREAADAFARVNPEQGWLRGWAGYWAYPTFAHHLLGDDRGALEIAREGRHRYPESQGALLAEVIPLASMGREKDIDDCIDESLRLPADATDNPSKLLRVALVELRGHGHEYIAQRVTARAAQWLATQPQPTTTDDKLLRLKLLYAMQHWDEAWTLVNPLPTDVANDVTWLGYRGAIAARRGDSTEAKRVARELAVHPYPYSYGEPALWRARIAAVLGDRDQAVALVREAFAQGLAVDLYLHALADFASLRGYAPFDELMRPRG